MQTQAGRATAAHPQVKQLSVWSACISGEDGRLPWAGVTRVRQV